MQIVCNIQFEKFQRKLSLDDEHKFMQYAIYHCSIVLPIREYRMVDNMLKWAYRAHSEYEKHKFDESETIIG